MTLINVKNLNFDYSRKNILKDINFTIAEGSVTALVGPNGAGKTTLLRCMTSLETPLSGEVVIDGIDVHEHPRQAHKKMGYLSDFFGVYDDLTVKQCLTYMAWCHNLESENLNAHVEHIAKEVDLDKHLEHTASALSRGYKQRLGVGLALIHKPKLILLDEPASGMDPEARVQFSKLILRLQQKGMTIIVSSHILAELEEYCTDMLVIREGEIKSHVSLKEHTQNQLAIIQITLNTVDKKNISTIETYEGVDNLKVKDNIVEFSFNDHSQEQQKLLKYLIDENLPISSFTPVKKTLQEAYMDLAEEKEAQ